MEKNAEAASRAKQEREPSSVRNACRWLGLRKWCRHATQSPAKDEVC